MNLDDYGIGIGNPADLIVLDTRDSRFAVAELPDVLMGFKRGRQTFQRQRPALFRTGR
jgi:cytosine deaminase